MTLHHDGIADFKRGSYSAVRELFDDYYEPLVEFATQLIIHDREAHHIVQETFIKLFGMRERFDTTADIKAFLYITVRNTCFMYIKQEKEEASVEQAATDDKPDVYATAAMDDEETRSAVLHNIHDQVAGLPEPEQTVFRLLFYDHRSIPSVAEQLKLTPLAVGQSRVQAVRLLREKLIAAGLFTVPTFIYFVAVFCGEPLS
jgi:RNA polymerase sigma-70 factor (ECF subfamily)